MSVLETRLLVGLVARVLPILTRTLVAPLVQCAAVSTQRLEIREPPHVQLLVGELKTSAAIHGYFSISARSPATMRLEEDALPHVPSPVPGTVVVPVHTGIIWPHGWPKVIFQSWNIIMILLTAIEKCCGYSKSLRLFHSYVWFICDNRSKLKKSGILSGGPLSTKKP